ncbi:MAG: methylglutaconyl-CoA hydratase [Sphingobacteriales bacterium]|jgi:methylglutaconyl-CoA hydratase
MEFVQYSSQNRIGTITLNRPDKRNALNERVVLDLLNAFNLAEEDENCKVVILKANGDVFCAGADLAYLQQLQKNTFDENLADSRFLKSLFERIYTFPKVVIAQVHGHAIAGGAGLATVCDLVYAVPEAKMGYTEVGIGFIPAIVSVFLIRKIGEGRSKDLLLTGRLIQTSEALEMGMINGVFDAGNLEEGVLKVASNLVNKCSGQSLTNTKVLIRGVQDKEAHDALEWAAHLNAQGRESDDCKRGIAAFLNKEKLSW